MKKNLLTTGEFASLCSTQKGTLLFYEKEGLLRPKHVSENRYRRYGVEQFFENGLHCADLAADADLSAELFLQIGRGRKMVGVGVGFEQPVDGQPVLSHIGNDLISAVLRGSPRFWVVIEHAVDDCGALRGRISNDVSDGERGRVKEGLDVWHDNSQVRMNMHSVCAYRRLSNSPLSRWCV